jgi:hypothetical protein
MLGKEESPYFQQGCKQKKKGKSQRVPKTHKLALRKMIFNLRGLPSLFSKWTLEKGPLTIPSLFIGAVERNYFRSGLSLH